MNIYKECFKLIDIKKFKFYFFFIITFFTINSLLELIGLSFILLIISFFLNNGDLNFGFLSINQINEFEEYTFYIHTNGTVIASYSTISTRTK